MTSQTCPNCSAPMTGEAGFGMVICNACGDLVMLSEAESTPAATPINSVISGAQSQIQDLGFSSLPQQEPDSEKLETFQDVAEFGNQELISPGSGGLVYQLDIEGVDTAEYRQEVIDVISDPRLGLNSKALTEAITDGILRIPELNPVKASVILTRLRPLSLKIKWSSKQMIKAVTAFVLIVGFGRAVYADDWAKHEASLNNYAGRINSMQEEIHDLIVKKNQNKDSSKRDALLDEIKKKNDALKMLYQSYRDEKDQILYQHPEQGDNSERKYHHVKMKTLEEMEGEPGVDGQLTRLRSKVEEIYPEKTPPQKAPQN